MWFIYLFIVTKLFIYCYKMCKGRKLDCVYYYMRSLAASNPFLSARESLMQLFDDAARKVLLSFCWPMSSCVVYTQNYCVILK